MARPSPELFNPGGYRYVTDTGGNTVVDYSAVTRPKYRRDYTGSITPGFNNMSSRQVEKLPTLPHTVDLWTVTASECVQTENFRHTLGSGAGKTFYRTTRWDRDRSRDLLSVAGIGNENEADSKALAKLSDEIRGAKVNLAQNFAERRQLAGLATNTIYRIAAAAMAMRRGDLRSFNQALHIDASPKGWAVVTRDPASKRLANHWLEYKFGWTPLLSDIYDSAELLAKHISEDSYHQDVHAGATTRKFERWQTLAGTQRTIFEAVYLTRVKYGVRFRADSVSRQILSSTGMSNPALLAWELLPYSFVIDWFYPVGSYLEALDAYSGMAFVDGWKVTYREGSSTCNRFGTTTETWSNPYWYSVSFSGFVSSARRSVVRSRLTAFPNAQPPKWQNPLGGNALSRFVTAAALLRQVFK